MSNQRSIGIHRALALAILAVSGWFGTQSAHAQCIEQPEQGKWTNTDPNTRSLTRIDLRFTCQDQVHNGQPYPPGPPWHVHVFGKCHPTDCDWGEVGAQRLTAGHTFAVYDQGPDAAKGRPAAAEPQPMTAEPAPSKDD